MKKIRIGNDISVTWNIKVTGSPYHLEGKTLALYLTSPNAVRIQILDFTVSESLLSFTFYGKDQKTAGIYTLSLFVNSGDDKMLTFDCCNAFQIVDWTCQADAEQPTDLTLESDTEVNIVHPVVPVIGENGNWWIDGEDTGKPAYMSAGMSAYDIAVVHGFEGTEEEWLASLKAGFGDVSAEAEMDTEVSVSAAKSVSGNAVNVNFKFGLPEIGRLLTDFFDFFDFASLDPVIDTSVDATGALAKRVQYSDNVIVCFGQINTSNLSTDGQKIAITRQKDFSVRGLGRNIRTIKFHSDEDAFPAGLFTPDSGHVTTSGEWVGNAPEVTFTNTNTDFYYFRRMEIVTERNAANTVRFDFTKPQDLNPAVSVPSGDLATKVISGTIFTAGPSWDTVSVQFTSARVTKSLAGIRVVAETGIEIKCVYNLLPTRKIKMIVLKGVPWTVAQSSVSIDGSESGFDDYWVWTGEKQTVNITIASDKTLTFESMIIVTDKLSFTIEFPSLES